MFRRQAPLRSSTSEEENPFLLSISDLMAALLAVFVLAVVLMMIQLERKKKELEEDRRRIEITRLELIDSLKSIQETNDEVGKAIQQVSTREQNLAELLGGMQRELAGRGIQVALAESSTVLRIKEDELSFSLGSHDIPPQSKPIVDAIGEVLLNWLSPEERRRELDTVFVEGHSDSVKNFSEMGNWGLSSYRAISLWRYWTENPGEQNSLAQLPNANDRPLFSVSGYSNTRPVDFLAMGETREVEESSKDRRIDIRFTLIAVEEEQLDEILTKHQATATELERIILKISPETSNDIKEQ